MLAGLGEISVKYWRWVLAGRDGRRGRGDGHWIGVGWVMGVR